MLRTSILMLSVVCLTAPVSSANDIVDFLRAIQGPPVRQYQPVSTRSRVTSSIHDPRARDIHVHDRNVHDRHSAVDLRQSQFARSRVSTVRPAQSRVSFNISFGNAPRFAQLPAPPVPVAPVLPNHGLYPVAPAPGNFGHVPHQPGDIVACPVHLETCVKIKDIDEIAPGAIPVIVAVRDPHLAKFGSSRCVEQLVYVEVLVPPCPLQRLKVSPCKTKIRLDYGRYEVDITSRNGVIEIDYDN